MDCPPPPRLVAAVGPVLRPDQSAVKSTSVAPSLVTPSVFSVSALNRATTFDPARESTATPKRLPAMLLWVKVADRVLVGVPKLSPLVRMPAPTALVDRLMRSLDSM